ncbi:hypothetical protein H5410_007386 [Solanum commersonii]|uniref:Pectinesterase inhibitor domain-containing protein n=1 Tax=Solanum commersonii TaxID=4109 RepID=A0A9J6ACC3_SOLCO|nr:hypothetical protein H5410_007386 [Solanum commersonii]
MMGRLGLLALIQKSLWKLGFVGSLSVRINTVTVLDEALRYLKSLKMESKDTNNERKKELTGTSSTSDEVEKADEDQMVDEQLHEDRIALWRILDPIDLSQKNTQYVRNLVAMLFNKETNSTLKTRYSLCWENYNDAIANLGYLPDLLKSKDYEGLNTHASAALSDPSKCDANFSEPPVEPI